MDDQHVVSESEASEDVSPDHIPLADFIPDGENPFEDGEPENPELNVWEELIEDAPIQAKPVSFTPLTRTVARGRREREAAGYIFPLYNTLDDDGNPTSARVRRINIMDRAVIGSLPKKLQGELLDAQAERAKVQRELKQKHDNGQKIDFTNVVLREMHRNGELAKLYAVAGFIEPRVYMTEKEAELSGGVWVEDIDNADLMAYMAACDGQREAVALLTPFRQEHAGPVPDREVGPDLSGPDAEPDSPDQDDPLPPIIPLG